MRFPSRSSLTALSSLRDCLSFFGAVETTEGGAETCWVGVKGEKGKIPLFLNPVIMVAWVRERPKESQIILGSSSLVMTRVGWLCRKLWMWEWSDLLKGLKTETSRG